MWYEPKEKTLHSGSAATGNGQIFDLEGKYGALRLQVIGITSATITFEQSNNGGTTWDGIAGINTETGAKVTTTTADGTFLFPIPGVKKFRARISTYVTGTINVYAVAVPADVASMEVILSSGDVEIGAVELKNATTDDRAIVTAGGEVYADTRKIAGVTPQFDDTDKFAVSVYGKSAAAGDTPVLVDATGHVQVDVVGALPAGSAIIGKTGIDQTTPGTTNGVQVNAALPAGTAIIGKTGIDQTTPGTTNAVTMNAENTVDGARPTKAVLVGGSGPTSTIRAFYANVVNSDGVSLTDVYHQWVSSRNSGFNGSTWDRWRNNQSGTALASAARTASNQSSDQVNYNGHGLFLHIKVTSITDTPSITVAIEGKNAAGVYFTLLTSAAITATGDYLLTVAPWAAEVANVSTAKMLPRTWRINITHADADSITYGIYYDTDC